MRVTVPECCATCEHRAVDTRMWADTGRREEETYCGYDPEMPFPSQEVMVTSVCDRYERSWGVEQRVRVRQGLPELGSRLYPYNTDRIILGTQEDMHLASSGGAWAGGRLLPEAQMQIFDPDPPAPIWRTAQVLRDGVWVTIPHVRQVLEGEVIRLFEDPECEVPVRGAWEDEALRVIFRGHESVGLMFGVVWPSDAKLDENQMPECGGRTGVPAQTHLLDWVRVTVDGPSRMPAWVRRAIARGAIRIDETWGEDHATFTVRVGAVYGNPFLAEDGTPLTWWQRRARTDEPVTVKWQEGSDRSLDRRAYPGDWIAISSGGQLHVFREGQVDPCKATAVED